MALPLLGLLAVGAFYGGVTVVAWLTYLVRNLRTYHHHMRNPK